MSKYQKHQEKDQEQKSIFLLWLGVGVVILFVIVAFFGIMMPTPTPTPTDAGVVATPPPTSRPTSLPAAVVVAPTTRQAASTDLHPKVPVAAQKDAKKLSKKKARKRTRRIVRKKRFKGAKKQADGKQEEMDALRSRGAVDPRLAVAQDPMRGKEAGVGGTQGKGTPAELSKATTPAVNGDALRRAKVSMVAAVPVKPVAFTLFFRNQIERTQIFRLLEVECLLDGKSLLKSSVERMPGLRDKVEVLQSSLLPGSYKFTLKVTARGHGLGVFAYRKTFRYNAESVINLEVRAGNAMRVVAELRDVGGQDEKKRIQVFFLTREK